MTEAPKLLAPPHLLVAALATAATLWDREDDAAFELRFSPGLLEFVRPLSGEGAIRSGAESESLAELPAVTAIAFALSVERAVFCLPRDPARRCEHAHLPWGPLTASLPHGTVHCTRPACVAEYGADWRIVMDQRCDLCDAEGSFTQITYPLAGWRVVMNICDGCAEWAPAVEE